MVEWFRQLNLVQRYSLVALPVLLLAMMILGWWVGREIKTGIINRVSGDSALFVENFVVENLQELAGQDFISEGNQRNLGQLLNEGGLGSEIAAFKIWLPSGKVVYGDRQGEVLEVEHDLEEAFEGQVHAGITLLEDAENSNLKSQYGQLLEIYVPIRLAKTNRVIAVVEFYQAVDALRATIFKAQRQSWLMVALVMLGAYILLVNIVRQGHGIIVKQQNVLTQQVQTLNTLLRQNEELTERVRRASLRTAAHNEQFLSRISKELDEGPMQELSLSLAQMDSVASAPREKQTPLLAAIYQSLYKVTQDIRNIASGLRLPELEPLGVSDIIDRVVRDHERRTRSFVEVKVNNLPRYVMLPIKATLFRMLQESLAHVYHHSEASMPQVFVQMVTRDKLLVEVRDQGAGHDAKQQPQGVYMGLSGMRERIESVGGTFAIHSHVGQGMSLRAEIPLNGEVYEAPEVAYELGAVA